MFCLPCCASIVNPHNSCVEYESVYGNCEVKQCNHIATSKSQGRTLTIVTLYASIKARGLTLGERVDSHAHLSNGKTVVGSLHVCKILQMSTTSLMVIEQKDSSKGGE